MERLVPLGRLFFAIALIAFGVLSFVYGEFVAGRAPPWPSELPGRVAWVAVTGTTFILAGLSIVFGVRGRYGALTAGVLILLWALIRQIPLAAADPTFGVTWTQLGKALFLFAGAFAVAGSLPRAHSGGPLAAFASAREGFIALGRTALALFFLMTGVQHFLFLESVATLVPGWIPGAVAWTRFAGVALIAGGIGMLIPWTERLAATLSGVMVFLWFLMLHIPRAMGRMGNGNEWIAVFEALAVSGLAFLYAGVAHERRGPRGARAAGTGEAAAAGAGVGPGSGTA